MKKTILFDLDGTLVDSGPGITKCAQYALDHFGIHEPETEKLAFFVGPPLMNTFMEHYGFSEEQAKQAVAKYRERACVLQAGELLQKDSGAFFNPFVF